MTENYEILKRIAENSGRISYITDGKYELLWSNTDTPLAEVLMGLKKTMSGKKPRRETVMGCTDGRCLKVTPVLRGGEPELYLFEIYGSTEVLEMLGATSVFRGFAETAEKARYTMLDYARELGESVRAYNESKFGKLCSSSVNFITLLKIIGGSGNEGAEDLSERLRQISWWFSAAGSRTEDFIFESDIDNELYAVTEKNFLECAAVNLLMNAYLHSVPPEGSQKHIKITAYADAGMAVIDIDDNGVQADPERISGFREVYLQPRGERAGEGLGISLAEAFCRRYGGSLSFLASPAGGLRARMALPLCDPRSKLTLLSPSASGKSISAVRDIMRKGFEWEELTDIV